MKMKVKVAAQQLTHTVAAAIETYSYENLFVLLFIHCACRNS
jgi:hypothetical protein